MTDVPTLGAVTEATIAGIVADAKGTGASVEAMVAKVVAALKADEVKAKADAIAWYKAAVVAVGSRAVYAGLGALAMFLVLRVV